LREKQLYGNQFELERKKLLERAFYASGVLKV